MPVIGIDQVPRDIVRPKWYEDLGYAFGSLGRAILLANMGGGVGKVPTSGTYQSPGMPPSAGVQGPLTQQGAFTSPQTFSMNPQGRVASGSYAGNTLSQLADQGIVPRSAVNWQQPTTLGMLPNLERQSTQADIAYKQAQTQSLTPEFQADLLRRYQGLAPTDQGKGAPSDFASQLRTLSQQSESEAATGQDGPATKRLRLILQLLRGE